MNFLDGLHNNPNLINAICIEANLIGKGGNGKVYKVPNEELVIKKLIFKTNKRTNNFGNKRYQ